MARPALKLASGTAPPQRSEEREALARVRAELDAVLAEQREIDGALTALRSTCYRAENAVGKAQADLEQAKSATAIAHARTAVQLAEDELQAATRTKAELVARRTELTTSLPLKQVRFDAAFARAVAVDPAVAGLLGEFDTALARLIELHQAVEWLGSEMLPEDIRSKFFARTRERIPLPMMLERHKSPSPLAATWREALARLRQDADAELPAPPVSRIETVIVDPARRERRLGVN